MKRFKQLAAPLFFLSGVCFFGVSIVLAGHRAMFVTVGATQVATGAMLLTTMRGREKRKSTE